MPLVLAIEPDPRQASVLERVVKGQVRAELVLVDSKDAALAALGARIPDLILVTALMPPRDEDEIANYLRTLPRADHVQTLAIPLLADHDPQPSLGRRLFNPLRRKAGKAATDGCAPTTFGEQVQAYLQRAAESREEAGPEAARADEDVVQLAMVGQAEAPAVDAFVPFDPIEVAELPESVPVDPIEVAERPESVPVDPIEVAERPESVPVEAIAIEAVLQQTEDAAATMDAEPSPLLVSADDMPEFELPALPPAEEPATEIETAAPIELSVGDETTDKPQPDDVMEDMAADGAGAQPVVEAVQQADVEERPEPEPTEDTTRWIWTDVRPLPAMMMFQLFLADSREESPVRAYQLRRAQDVDVRLMAEHSVVSEAPRESVDAAATEPREEAPAGATPAVADIDTSLWDKLFVALEDRFSQEKEKVASTEKAAAEQARKYMQARKAARRRTRKPDPLVPPAVPPARKGGNPLDSLRGDIERLLHKSGIPERKREPRQPRTENESQGEPTDSPARPPKQRERSRPATARLRDTAQAPSTAEDEWGLHDPAECGFAAVLEKLDERDREARANAAAAGNADGSGSETRRDEPARIAPLSVWAHAVSQDSADEPPPIIDPLSPTLNTDPTLRLPDDVVAVRYASGCRIGEIHVAERPIEPDEGDQPVVLLSKKLLKKPR